jgi:hypothetical protein
LIGLSLIAGAPCAFLALESIGIPLVLLTVILLTVIGRRLRAVPETLLAFSLSYLAVVSHFAIPDLNAAASINDVGNVVYAVIELGFASILLLTALILLALKRWPAARDQAA